MNISVIILTKNEAEVIEKCLNSLSSLHADEILVIDDRSTDETAEIAKKRGVKVIFHTKKDFADARNFGLQKTKSEWILYIDADEQVSVELAQEIIKVIVSDTKTSAYTFPRINYYLGKKWPYVEKVTRLFRKKKLQGWYGKVHESPRVAGEIKSLTKPLLHHTHRSLSEMVENTIIWSKIEAKLRFESGHPPVVWWRIPRVMLPLFWNYYIQQGGWKVGTVGLIESIYQAFSIFITYSRLWELQQKNIYEKDWNL